MRGNANSGGEGGICEAMERSAMEVLETMFFTSFEESGPRLPDWRDSPIAARVTFNGSLAGDFRLLIEPETARALASTFLCASPDEIGHEREIQLAGEMATMICGSLLSRLDPDANLILGVPEPATEIRPGEAIRRGFRLPEGAVGMELLLKELR